VLQEENVPSLAKTQNPFNGLFLGQSIWCRLPAPDRLHQFGFQWTTR